jgi:potassium-transporting ATPase KdpC subunit
MKNNLLQAVRLTLICILVFCGLYSLLILAIAQAAPARGKGETVIVDNKVVGWKLLGQKFTDNKYFQGRPSTVGYNAAASGGSNKGPTNPDYLKQVKDRIDTFLVHNPEITKNDIPSDLVTASGAGLDPDISVKGASVQIYRIARIRKVPVAKIRALVESHIEGPWLGLFGTERVNVLQLNIDMDKSK